MARTKREQRLSIRVAGPLRDGLEAQAASAGRQLAEHVRQVLIDHLAQRVAVPAQQQPTVERRQ
jgi:hypothetical protein